MRENPLKPRVTLTTSGSKMKDKPLFGCPNRPAALIAAMAAALLLAPGTVFAQGAYYQFYNLALGIENVSPADSQYTEAFADLPAPGGKGSERGQERGQLMVMAYSSVACQGSNQNQPAKIESKPASLRRGIHIGLLVFTQVVSSQINRAGSASSSLSSRCLRSRVLGLWVVGR